MSQDFWFGATAGAIAAMTIVTVVFSINIHLTITRPINECERANNVYLCTLVPTPVDPFHPEEN